MSDADTEVIGRTIEAIDGEASITLEELGGAGYVWHLDREASDPKVSLINRSYPAREWDGSIGGPRPVTFRFVSPAAGSEVRAVLKHIRPWDQEAAPAQIINVSIRGQA